MSSVQFSDTLRLALHARRQDQLAVASVRVARRSAAVALDHVGPRKVRGHMLMVATAGAVLFAQAQSLGELVLARGMIGLGVAGSLMSAIKASSLWVPAARLPLTTAVLRSVVGLGAMASTTPMHWALSLTSWRGAFLVLAVGTLLVAALILLAVPEHPSQKDQTRLADMVKAVLELYGAWSFWRLALYTLMAHATCMAVQGLWMGPWLRDVGQLSREAAAQVLFAGTAAMVLGPQTLPLPPLLVAVGFSFFGTATTMNYAIVAQSVPSHLTERATTSFNLLVFLLAIVVQ